MRISTSNWNLSSGRQQQPLAVRAQQHGDPASIVDLDLVPAVADRIKAFEDLIRRASRSDSISDDAANRVKNARSQSCPARNMSDRFDSSKVSSAGRAFQYGQSSQPETKRPEPSRRFPPDSGNGSNLSLFSGGSSSSGYTSTTPPSPEPDMSSSRSYILHQQSALLSGRSSPPSHYARVDDDDDDEEEKRIELEIFARHPSGNGRNSRLFSPTSTEDEVDVDEDEIDDIRWSDLESESELADIHILIPSKTSDEVHPTFRAFHDYLAALCVFVSAYFDTTSFALLF